MAKLVSALEPHVAAVSVTVARQASSLHLLLEAARMLRTIGQPLPTSYRSVLACLGTDPVRVSTVAQQLHISKQAVSQAVEAMERAGLVHRTADPRDGRAKLVQLSDRGASFVLSELAALQSLEEQLVDALGAKPMIRLRKALQKLLPYLKAEKMP